MPMFDDPQEQLRRMQAELLAAEEEDEYDDLSDIDDLLQDYLDEEDYDQYSEEAEAHPSAYRNYANNYGRRRAARFVDTDSYEDDLDDAEFLSREDHRKGKQSNKGLLILICVELVAIAAVLGWWALWLL